MTPGLVDGTVLVDARALLTLHKVVQLLADQIIKMESVPVDHPMSEAAIEARYLVGEAMKQMIKMRRMP